MSQMTDTDELKARDAFDMQSPLFDNLYKDNSIIQYKRDRVRECALQYLQPGDRILELNAGTGEDAVYFAEKGMHVHATDISERMQDVLKKKVENYGLKGSITTEICSFTNLSVLKDQGPYDLIFSNFGGLNCTSRLETVLLSFPGLVKPGGTIVLVIMPGFCFWETLLFLKGNFKSALRRFNSRNGASAQIEGVKFKCWYYSPHFVVKALRERFSLLSVEALCSIVPPSYLESFPLKYPGIFKFLVRVENEYKGKWPWKYIGDYYIISMKRDR